MIFFLNIDTSLHKQPGILGSSNMLFYRCFVILDWVDCIGEQGISRLY